MEMTLLDAISNYWTIIIFIGGLIGNYASMKAAIKQLRERDDIQDLELKDVRIELKANSAQFTQLQVDIQAIKTALEYIKTEMVRK